MGLTDAELDSIMIESKGGHGALKHLGPVLRMSETKPYWDKPSPVLGSNKPEWLSLAGSIARCAQSDAKRTLPRL